MHHVHALEFVLRNSYIYSMLLSSPAPIVWQLGLKFPIRWNTASVFGQRNQW